MSGESPAEGDSEVRAAQRARRKMPPRAYLIALAAAVTGLFAGFSLASQSVPPAPIPSELYRLETPTETTIPGDGTFLVGRSKDADVRPGLYHSSRNANQCTWKRATDATGEPEAIIARDTSRGESYVELQAGDVFDTSDCRTWQLVPMPKG